MNKEDLSLWALLIIVLLGCSSLEPTDTGEVESADAHETSEPADRATVKATAEATTAPAPGSGKSTGIAECDEYLALLARCSPHMQSAIPSLRASYKLAASFAQSREAIAKSCSDHAANTPCSGDLLPPPPAPTGGPSKPPTTAEWDAVTKEVTVHGSSSLGCETKMLRQWLRISCRGTNEEGGKPTGLDIQVKQGNHSAMKYIATGKVVSLLLRFVPGVRVEALFHWTNLSRKLVVHWPRGAPEPQAKGKFEPRRRADE